MNKKFKERFINTYENHVKYYRDDYYKNIINNKNTISKNIHVNLFIIPILISLVIFAANKFELFSLVTAFIINIIGAIVIKLINIDFNLEGNAYLKAVKKAGTFSIEEYERKLKKYITGENGYYKYLLDELVIKYHLSIESPKIYESNGNMSFIWTNKRQDTIYLLPYNHINHPKVIEIKIDNVRYYRLTDKELILITNNEDYYFKLEALDILKPLLPNKRYEDITTYDPEKYIDDFEFFMHKKEKAIRDIKEHNEKQLSINKTVFAVSLIAMIIITLLPFNKYPFVTIINLINALLLIVSYMSIVGIVNVLFSKQATEKDIITNINNDPECIERFNELKFALKIKDSYNTVYTKENARYLVWSKNGYFHAFLNMIYFNVVYMAVKIRDVKYYKVTNDSVEIKLKDKTLEFRKDSASTFSKILLNKDYDWLKQYQK